MSHSQVMKSIYNAQKYLLKKMKVYRKGLFKNLLHVLQLCLSLLEMLVFFLEKKILLFSQLIWYLKY